MAEDQPSNSALLDHQPNMTEYHNVRRDRIPSSNSSTSLEDSYEIVSATSEAQVNRHEYSGVTDADLSDPSISSENEDDPHNLHDEDDKLYKRLTKLRNFKRKSFASPTNFRVLYVGSTQNETLKRKMFLKLSESLSNIFWEEVEGNPSNYEIGPEKKINLVPVSFYREPECHYYDDSGVSITQVDLTNRPFEVALSYLETQFQRQEKDDDLVDLCVFFIPTDLKLLIAKNIPTMKKLKGKVTLFPVISSVEDLNGSGIYFQNEIAAKRKSIVKCLEENGIDIFVWKDDKLMQDRDANGDQAPNWVESIFTKKILAVEEFAKMDPNFVFEDMQLLRERSLEMRKERKHAEMVKKRAQNFERIVEILRTFTIMLSILYTIYLVVFGVWSYAEWSVIPSNLRESLQVVTTATSGMQLEDLPSWQPADTVSFGDPGRIEVYQLSKSRFLIETYSKRGEAYEVVVKHNPQPLLRYDAVDLGNGQYSFEIDTIDAIGDVIVEIWEKYGELARVVKWSPHKVDQIPPRGTERLTAPGSEAMESKSLYEYTTIAVRNINQFAQPILRRLDELLRAMGDNMHVAGVYISNQAYKWGSFVWDNVKARLIRWGKIAKYILQQSIDNVQAYFYEQ